MIKSVFSNGIEDVYKGHRDVKAGWMITKIEDGSVWAMGHSLDLAKAEKTARTNLPKLHHDLRGKWSQGKGRELGKLWNCSPRKALYKAGQENAEYQAKFKIEVVEVVA